MPLKTHFLIPEKIVACGGHSPPQGTSGKPTGVPMHQAAELKRVSRALWCVWYAKM